MRRHWASLIPAAILTALVLNCLHGPESPFDLVDLTGHARHLARDNDNLRAENAELTAEIGKLKTSDAYLQRLIRRRLGYARPDEFVYQFRSDPPPNP